MGPWLLGTALGLLGIVGLFMASYASDSVFHGTGLGLFLFCVLAIGWLIRRGTKPHGDEA
jgi:hypothetical protein